MTVRSAKAALTKAEKHLEESRTALTDAEAKVQRRTRESGEAKQAYHHAASLAADGKEKPAAITKLREASDIALGAVGNAQRERNAAREVVAAAEAGVKEAKDTLWHAEHEVRMAKRQELADAMLDALFEWASRWRTLYEYDHDELVNYFHRASSYEVAGGMQHSATPLHEGEGMLILAYLIKTAQELTEKLPFNRFWPSICDSTLTNLNEPFDEILRDLQRVRTERMDSVIANGARWTHDNHKMRRRYAYRDPLSETDRDGNERGPQIAY